MRKFFFLVLSLVLGVFSFSYLGLFRGVDKIPVYFFPFSDSPLVKGKMSQKELLLKIDLGFSYGLSLSEELLKEIQDKEQQDSIASIDMKGNRYESPTFALPPLKVGNYIFSHLKAKQESVFFLTKGARFGSSKEGISHRRSKELSRVQGRLGLKAFQNGYFLFDFPHTSIFYTNTLDDLKKIAQSYRFASSKFSLETGLVSISIGTDFGEKRFILDTASSCSVLKKGAIDFSLAQEVKPGVWSYSNKKLKIGDVEFPSVDFYLFDFALEGVDGILGIDFLKKYAFYCDFEDENIYVQIPI